MKFNSLLPVLVSGVTLSSIFLAGVLPANAVTLDYTVNGTFPAPGTFAGTFSVDSVTQSLTDYRITTTAGPGYGGTTYQFGAPDNSFFGVSANSFNLLKGPIGNCCGPVLQLAFNGSIFDPPSSGVLNVLGGVPNSFEDNGPGIRFARPVDSGIATLQPTQPIPEPLSIIGTLIGGSAVWRMRKKLTASTKVKVKQ